MARTDDEPASPLNGDVRPGSDMHRVRRLLSSARLVLDVIASTGARHMRLNELAHRMHLRGHSGVETNSVVVTLLTRGLLTSDEITVMVTDIGWQVTTRRTPLNRAKSPSGNSGFSRMSTEAHLRGK